MAGQRSVIGCDILVPGAKEWWRESGVGYRVFERYTVTAWCCAPPPHRTASTEPKPVCVGRTDCGRHPWSKRATWAKWTPSDLEDHTPHSRPHGPTTTTAVRQGTGVTMPDVSSWRQFTYAFGGFYPRLGFHGLQIDALLTTLDSIASALN